jgi:hypothetical protein
MIIFLTSVCCSVSSTKIYIPEGNEVLKSTSYFFFPESFFCVVNSPVVENSLKFIALLFSKVTIALKFPLLGLGVTIKSIINLEPIAALGSVLLFSTVIFLLYVAKQSPCVCCKPIV